MSPHSIRFEQATTATTGAPQVERPPAAFPARIPRLEPLNRRRPARSRRTGARLVWTAVILAAACGAWLGLELGTAAGLLRGSG